MVEKALSTFAKAKAEVNKANEHLREGVKKDTESVKKLQGDLDEARVNMMRTEANREKKLVAIEENNELIDELSKFTKGIK